MCPAHKTNSKAYRDEYDRIFKKNKREDKQGVAQMDNTMDIDNE